MAGFSQTYEVVPVNRGVIVEFHFHRPEVGFNQGKALFLLRQSREGEKKISIRCLMSTFSYHVPFEPTNLFTKYFTGK